MANVRLGAKAVGSIVKIKVNGAAKDFIIVHQGKPSSVYDDSCNGTWLLMKDIYTTCTFGNNNSYKDSSIHTYLNGTFYNLIDSDIRAAIKQVKIPYLNGTGGGDGSLATGANGLSTKVFLLSGLQRQQHCHVVAALSAHQQLRQRLGRQHRGLLRRRPLELPLL